MQEQIIITIISDFIRIKRSLWTKSNMALTSLDYRAPLREVKRVQFGILSPDELVGTLFIILIPNLFHYILCKEMPKYDNVNI